MRYQIPFRCEEETKKKIDYIKEVDKEKFGYSCWNISKNTAIKNAINFYFEHLKKKEEAKAKKK